MPRSVGWGVVFTRVGVTETIGREDWLVGATRFLCLCEKGDTLSFYQDKKRLLVTGGRWFRLGGGGKKISFPFFPHDGPSTHLFIGQE